MLFNSLHYAVFLPIVVLLYYKIPHKFRWILLLISSYYFYMSWNPNLVILILITTSVTYFCGILIEKTKYKKSFLAASIIICLGLLFYFKYFNFFSASAYKLLSYFSLPVSKATRDIVLPVGISFYTFQTLSYVIDVYRGKMKTERHFGYYSLYVSFFPQLVAGPIERPEHLLPQFKKEHSFDNAGAAYGAKLIAIGLFKKIVIADSIAPIVEKAFDSYTGSSPYVAILGAVLFAFQIYGDFSGYSDIARGSAKIMGIEIMENFKSPYFSRNIKEFWSRWHISLSTWFRDYLYIPLGGSRVKIPRYYFNLFITFLISGLWHGANWTFVLWGGYHGVMLIIYNMYLRRKEAKNKEKAENRKALPVLLTFVFVCAGWLIFRANDLLDVRHFIKLFFTTLPSVNVIKQTFDYFGVSIVKWISLAMSVSALMVYDYFSLERDIISLTSKIRKKRKWLVYYAIAIIIFIAMVINFGSNASQQFIYFQF